MIVCDFCKDIKKPGFQCHVSLSKEETKQGKLFERPVKKIPIHLCDDCISAMLTKISKLTKE